MERQDHLRGSGDGARPAIRFGERRARLIASLLASAIALAGFPVLAADDDLAVAVAGPMTGQYARFGQAMRSAGTEAVGRINAGGGIGGRKVQLLVEDDACDRAKAIIVAGQLVTRKVALVVGHHCASASIAAAPIYAAAGVIMISPGTTDPLLTDKRAGPTIFRLCHRDDREGTIAGTYIARNFADKRVALLHDRTVVGIKLANDAKKAMNSAGLAEALLSGFIAGEPDYSKLARDMKAHRIDVVYLGAYPNEAALIVEAMRKEQSSAIVVGSSLLAVDAEGAAKVPTRQGLLLTSLPGSDLAGAADNTRAAIEAWAKAAGDSDAAGKPADVARALQTGHFETVLNNVAFDRKGDATVPFIAMRTWRGGKLVPAP